MNNNLRNYYKNRASEYERIYEKPERQHDLSLAAKTLKEKFKDKEVLEIACGTGYWTKIISETAKQILATDVNESVIQIAKSKDYSTTKVDFQTVDLYEIDDNLKHESLFGGSILSHIDLRDLHDFINKLIRLVIKGGLIMLMDNNYVDGSSTPISEKDAFGNTYQIRTLNDGNEYKILKNFPGENFIRQQLSGKVADIKYIDLEYYWIFMFEISQ